MRKIPPNGPTPPIDATIGGMKVGATVPTLGTGRATSQTNTDTTATAISTRSQMRLCTTR